MRKSGKTICTSLVLCVLCIAGLAAAGRQKLQNPGSSRGSSSREKIPVLGSSGKLEGTIAIVTIFMNDSRTSWNFDRQEDYDMYSYAYYDVQIACEWLTKACKDYGRKVKFVWDWGKHEELCSYGSISLSATKEIENETYRADYEVQTFIRNNIDSERIKKSLGANGIIYLVCFNTPYSNKVSCCTCMWEKAYPRNEEFCYMFMGFENTVVEPAHFAHEILHTFGAPDLYYAGMYGITQEYVDYAESTRNYDIMGSYCGEDKATGQYVYDKVPNTLTDITAYYVGLTNSSKTVRTWGFEPSDYDSH